MAYVEFGRSEIYIDDQCYSQDGDGYIVLKDNGTGYRAMGKLYSPDYESDNYYFIAKTDPEPLTQEQINSALVEAILGLVEKLNRKL